MSIVIRCKCSRYYSLKQNKCPACGDENKKDRQYHIRYNGKTSYAGHSLTIAREMEAGMKKNKRLGGIDEYKTPQDISFGEFVTKYFEPHYATRKSAASIKSKTSYFMGLFKDRLMKGITPAEIEQVINLKAIGFAPRTRDYYLAVIRRIYNYAIELELLTKSPVKVRQLNVDNTRHRYLRDDEVERLLAACKANKSEYLYPMVMVALYTGMRLGEIQKLKKADLVDGMFYIKSANTKNNRNKIIPLNKELKEFIGSYLETHEDFDFNHTCKTSFNKVCAELGIKDFRFHDLRHTFASKLKANNVNDSVIQQLLGHQTPRMVQRYAHLSPESILNAVKIVDYGGITANI